MFVDSPVLIRAKGIEVTRIKLTGELSLKARVTFGNLLLKTLVSQREKPYTSIMLGTSSVSTKSWKYMYIQEPIGRSRIFQAY